MHDSKSCETEKYGLSPAGPGTKNICADEGQLQFTRNRKLVVGVSISQRRSSSR
jgi:hypothetical protein